MFGSVKRMTVGLSMISLILPLISCEEGGTQWQADANVDEFDVVSECVRFVDVDAATRGDGLSWESALFNIREGVESASEAATDSTNCEVWIKGEIEDNSDDLNEARQLLAETPRVTAYNEFEGHEAGRSQRHSRLATSKNDRSSSSSEVGSNMRTSSSTARNTSHAHLAAEANNESADIIQDVIEWGDGEIYPTTLWSGGKLEVEVSSGGAAEIGDSTTVAIGSRSTAIGRYANAAGHYSVAAGYRAETANSYSAAFGAWTDALNYR